MASKHQAHSLPSTTLSTELDALADGANKLSAAIDNATDRYLFGHFQLSLPVSTVKTGDTVEMYILPEIDGVFVSGGDTVDPEQGFVGSFVFPLSVDAWVAEIRNVFLPNSQFKILLTNSLGVALPATLNTLKAEYSNYEDA